MAATGLADAFGGACPPTYRAEYLPAGATPHCIDFILTAGEVTVESTALVFAEKEPLGYVSDHIGLRGLSNNGTASGDSGGYKRRTARPSPGLVKARMRRWYRLPDDPGAPGPAR